MKQIIINYHNNKDKNTPIYKIQLSRTSCVTWWLH